MGRVRESDVGVDADGWRAVKNEGFWSLYIGKVFGAPISLCCVSTHGNQLTLTTSNIRTRATALLVESI